MASLNRLINVILSRKAEAGKITDLYVIVDEPPT